MTTRPDGPGALRSALLAAVVGALVASVVLLVGSGRLEGRGESDRRATLVTLDAELGEVEDALPLVLDSARVRLRSAEFFLEWSENRDDASSGQLMSILRLLVTDTPLTGGELLVRGLHGGAEFDVRIDPELLDRLMHHAELQRRVASHPTAWLGTELDALLNTGAWRYTFGREVGEIAIDFKATARELFEAGVSTHLRGAVRDLEERVRRLEELEALNAELRQEMLRLLRDD